jgi:hypothetical protein
MPILLKNNSPIRIFLCSYIIFVAEMLQTAATSKKWEDAFLTVTDWLTDWLTN